VIATN